MEEWLEREMTTPPKNPKHSLERNIVNLISCFVFPTLLMKLLRDVGVASESYKSCISYNILLKQLFISYAPVLRKFSWGILSTWEFSFPFPQFNTVFCLNPRNFHPFQFKYTHFMCSKINKLIHKTLHTSVQVFAFFGAVSGQVWNPIKPPP